MQMYFILQEVTQTLLLVILKKNNKKHKTKTSLSFPNSLQLLSELAEETVFREFTDKPVK